MSADYFIFGDVDSRLLGLYLHNGSNNGRIRHIIGAKTNTTDRVLGRSGEILFDQWYEPKSIPLNVYSEGYKDNYDLRQISGYFGRLGQKPLTVSYEPYKFYNATFVDAVQATEFSGGIIIDEINFIALDPFGYSLFTTGELASGGLLYNDNRFYNSGLLYVEEMTPYAYTNITTGQSIEIYHGGNCDFAFPVFKFTGQATTLKVEQYSDVLLTNKINEFTYGAFNGTLDVDCNLSNVFKNGIMSNNTFGGSFMNLYGVTSPQFQNYGTIQSISSNLLGLDSTASSVDNYYNNMIIYLLEENGNVLQKRTIVDYDGITKTATLNSAFTGASLNQNYRIYNLVDGKNYFKITGTGFSSLGLTVDFRYVYL